ncbi:MAG: hypothetical protein LBF39_04655 [Prevotellaceae bacterium]|jgi:uncharacterized protein YjfI (DUF2170 family)|nr:hypothetical protein [Prevotellaceae bacterium]
MYRQVFIPNEQNSHVPFTIPREWYGQLVEVIVFPVSSLNNKTQQTNDDDFYKLYGAWESDQSAEDMIAELKTARKFAAREACFE